MNNILLVVSGIVAYKNSKINWPDLNYPNSGQTILRTIHDIDYTNYKIQLDGTDGPWFGQKTANPLPDEVGFFKRV